MLLGMHGESSKVIYEKIDSYKYVPIFIIKDSKDLLKERTSADFVIEKHWHRSIEIMYTNKSAADIVVNGEKIHLDKNSIYVVNSRDIHYVDLTFQHEQYTGYTIQLNYKFLKEVYPEFDSTRFFISDDVKEHILPVLEIIIRLYFEDIIKNKDIIIYLCKALIEILVIYASLPIIERHQSLDHKILKIIDYIDENYNQDLNMVYIAEQFNISYIYLAKLFKENLGVSAGQYISKLRYEKALIDISTTSKTITDIAYIHGFSNVSSLIREFKKYKGMTPSEYRKIIE